MTDIPPKKNLHKIVDTAEKRIVAKVDQLIAQCEDIEAELGKTQEARGKLLDAVVGQEVNGKGLGTSDLM